MVQGAREPEATRFSSQRLTLACFDWGGDGPPLLLVHGGRDQARSWDWTARALSPAFRVFAHDLRGHGRSDWVSDGAYTVMDHVYDLASLVDHLGFARVTLVGHSLGGNVVARYAGMFPDRVETLVAIEGLGPSPKLLAERAAVPVEDRLSKWIEERRKLSARAPRRMANVEAAFGRMKAAHGHLREDQLRHLTETGVRTHADGAVSWLYDPGAVGSSASGMAQQDLEHLWRRIACPAWLVYGAKSWASNPAEDGRAAHFANARITVVEEAGHWLHHDRFETWMQGLTAFLGSP